MKIKLRTGKASQRKVFNAQRVTPTTGPIYKNKSRIIWKKKNSKTLPLPQVNQLLIISNFATLCLKGVLQTQAILEIAWQRHKGQSNCFAQRVHALARHYQIFEKLPIEKHAGSANLQSWLHDEQVKTWTHDWLTSQKTGDVTPCWLQYALNEIIFPKLNINLAKGISECSTHQWLIKLGWCQTVVQKGVYMDGHECNDVVEYQNKQLFTLMLRSQNMKAPNWRKLCQRFKKDSSTLLSTIMTSAVSMQTVRHEVFDCKKVSSHFAKEAERG